MSRLKVGSVMILSGTRTPEQAWLNVKPYWKSWRLVGEMDGQSFDQVIRRVGWNFFYISGNIRAYMPGAGNETTIKRAMRRILGKVKSSSFNCVQVSEITMGRFLGVPYVRVTAHSRHVQKGNRLGSFKQRSRANADAVWSAG